MAIPLLFSFSKAADKMELSAIREMLKLTQKSDIISFAGGLPSPETFPVSDLLEITQEILETDGPNALQYGSTEGDSLLRQLLIERSIKAGLQINTENLLITSGSQQSLDLLCKIFIDPGDYIILGLPSYHGAINVFKVFGAEMAGIPLDSSGIIPQKIEETIVAVKSTGRKIRFIYLIPDFQNPTGITLSQERRKEIINIAQRHDLLIVEDSPYRDLRFNGEPVKTIYELDPYGRVILLNSFSKIFSPGFRLGWVTGKREVIEKLVMAKQSTDLCSPSFLQKILARYIQKGLLDKNLGKTIALYRARRNLMLSCLRKEMPEGIHWTEPDGGLFIFLTLPESIDATEILKYALEKKVAFVCGSIFFCNNSGQNTIRLNFSFASDSDIESGVERIASVLKEKLHR